MFTDATDRLPISEGSGIEFAVSWADYDLDGDLDLFLPRYPQSEPDLSGISPGIDSLLYENDGSNHFVDVSHLLPVDTNDGYPFVGGWHDLDEDGRPDLILANDHGHEVRSNRAWHNQPDGFVDVSKDWGLNIGIDAMGMAAGDVNRDGRPDFAWTGWPELEVLESDGMNWIRSGDARGLVPVRRSTSGMGSRLGRSKQRRIARPHGGVQPLGKLSGRQRRLQCAQSPSSTGCPVYQQANGQFKRSPRTGVWTPRATAVALYSPISMKMDGWIWSSVKSGDPCASFSVNAVAETGCGWSWP